MVNISQLTQGHPQINLPQQQVDINLNVKMKDNYNLIGGA